MVEWSINYIVRICLVYVDGTSLSYPYWGWWMRGYVPSLLLKQNCTPLKFYQIFTVVKDVEEGDSKNSHYQIFNMVKDVE